MDHILSILHSQLRWNIWLLRILSHSSSLIISSSTTMGFACILTMIAEIY